MASGPTDKMQKRSAEDERPSEADELEAFCKSVELEEMELADWQDCHDSLDLKVPIFVTADIAKSGGSKALKFSRQNHDDGQRNRVEIRVTIPAGCLDGQVIEVANAGDCAAGKRGKLEVIVRIKS